MKSLNPTKLAFCAENKRSAIVLYTRNSHSVIIVVSCYY